MAILLLEITAGLLPLRINPSEPSVTRHSGLLWIVADVVHDATQVAGFTNDAVEALLFPQFAGLTDRRIDVLSGDSLHRSVQVFHFVIVERTQDQMAMIGHDDPAVELIPLAVKMMQSVAQVIHPTSLVEVASAVTFVRPSFCAANNLASVIIPDLFGARF